MDASTYSTACMFTEDETRKLYDQEAALRGDENVIFLSQISDLMAHDPLTGALFLIRRSKRMVQWLLCI
jgi:hypothetical protein